MNKKHLMYAGLFCMCAGMALLTSCSNDEPLADGGGLHVYHIKAEVNSGTRVSSPQSRSLTEDESHNIKSAWETGDKLLVYNMSDNNASTSTEYGLVAAQAAGKTGNFDGTLVSKNPLTTNDDLCFFYPGAASVGGKKTIMPAKRMTGNGTDAPSVYYEPNNTITHWVYVDLRYQDGTVATIGKKFDFQWAKAKPSAINGSDVTVNAGQMQRKIAILGMRFADKNGNMLANIDSLTISNITSSDVLDLGTGEYVTDNTADETKTTVLIPADGTKLCDAGSNYAYAALLPGSYENVMIMAYIGNKSYARVYNTATFEQDKVYHMDVLNMEEVKTENYVEVEGVKWATGNFIHYNDGTNGEYWGVAPTQWWTSNYEYVKDGKYTTSQFAGEYRATVNDLDLFRYGTIVTALQLTQADYKAGSKNITKKFYVSDGDLAAETVVEAQIKYGDIVWYHTRNNHQKYRMPSEDELNKLYIWADVIAAYCYTDKGTKIYGAYFTTHKNGVPRLKNFPTGGSSNETRLAKYTNVTSLVRANQGLFLPITGMRNSILGSRDLIRYRDLLTSNAYGQYMSSLSNSTALSQDFFFGVREWNLSGNGKGQAKAIRPVWDESSSATDLDPVYPGFSGLQ